VVIAVGVIQVAGFTDIKINHITYALFDWQPGLVISGGITILVFAYAVRYLSVAMHNTDTGLERIKPNIDEVSASLGATSSQTLKKVHVPLLRASLISAFILVFVDVLKELPATLILRPFNVNTLAVKAYELASDERLIDAALPAVSIVLAGLLPVIFLTISLEKQKS
jgi:iron(III) transport system permease protein